MKPQYLLGIILLIFSFTTKADIVFRTLDNDFLNVPTSQISASLSYNSIDQDYALHLTFDKKASLALGEFTEKHLKKKITTYINKERVNQSTLQSVLGIKPSTPKQQVMLIIDNKAVYTQPSVEEESTSLAIMIKDQSAAIRYLKHLSQSE